MAIESTPLERAFFARSALRVAPDLLLKLFTVDGRVVRIVETEAYLATDAASHSFRGPTARNACMFGEAGHLYVYLIYGMHWCANVVTGPTGVGEAVLLRGAEVVSGFVAPRPPGPGRGTRIDGPGRLARALGIEGGANGTDVCDRVTMAFSPDSSPSRRSSLVVTPRVGISVARSLPWRFRVGGASDHEMSVPHREPTASVG